MTRTERGRAWRAKYIADHGLEALRAYRAAERRRWRERHPEKAKARDRLERERRDRNKRAAVMRSWRERNADHVKAYEAEYWRAHPDEFRLKCRLNVQRRRARKRGAEGTFTKDDVENLFLWQEGRCRCGATDRLEIDHKRPLVRGGSNWPTNLQLLCRSCNAKKHTKED